MENVQPLHTENAPPQGVDRSTATTPVARTAAATIPEEEEFADAINRSAVSFRQLATAAFGRFNKTFSERERHAYRERYPKLLEKFEERHGDLSQAYYGRHLEFAAGLTTPKDEGQGDTIHLECGADVRLDRGAEELLFKCCALSRHAYLTLSSRDRKICMEMIFGVISGLLKSLDRAAGSKGASEAGETSCREIRYLEQEHKRAHDYYERSAQRQAQMHYFLGMLGGLAVIVGLAAVMLLALSPTSNIDESTGFFLVSLVAGSAGAMVSVMYGITSGTLRLNDLVLSGESGPRVLSIAGVMRPLLGAVFGVVLYVLLESRLLPLAGPAEESKRIFFYMAVAFLAGFSERWARGIVAGTEKQIGSTGKGAGEQIQGPLAPPPSAVS